LPDWVFARLGVCQIGCLEDDVADDQ